MTNKINPNSTIHSFSISGHLVRFLVLSTGLFVASGCADCSGENLDQIPEPGQISGRICDPGEAKGIWGADVYVLTSEDGSERIGTTTNADGSFLLEDIPEGTYTVYVERGSFSTTVEGVEVLEENTTALNEDDCVEPDQVTMSVYEGHDEVEKVLERLGYNDFALHPTYHHGSDRDDDTESWLKEAFSVYENFSDNNILFINCAAHEWAVEKMNEDELETVLNNLRRFIEEGGSIYLSDWSYDLLELLYPDAVNWLGDDNIQNDAENGVAQEFVGSVIDQGMAATGLDRVLLRFEQSRIAIPLELGNGTRMMIRADVMVEQNGEEELFEEVPVLLEHRPLNIDPARAGRVIYTTFHNGNNNTQDMDDLLRNIIFSL
jgi:hypothetical protein